MASRRSRLQIKPNIGPKVPAGKATSKAKEGKDTPATAEALDRKKSVPKDSAVVTSPEAVQPGVRAKLRRFVEDSTTTPNASESDLRTNELSEALPDIEQTALSSSVKEVESAAEENQNKALDKDVASEQTTATVQHSESEMCSSASTRGSDKSRSSDGNSKTTQTDTSPSLSRPDIKKQTSSAKDDTPVVSGKETSKAAKSKAAPAVRARLPRAKPNFLEANKRRQKPAEQKEVQKEKSSTPSAGSSKDSNSAATTPTAKIVLAKSTKDSNSPTTTPTAKIDAAEAGTKPQEEVVPTPPEPVPEQPQSVVDQSRAPAPAPAPLPRPPIKITPAVPSSPVKQPGDKRARTVSVNEPAPVKKAKKPVITAPKDKPPDRTTMRMKDLIYWNPSNNPMKVKETAEGEKGEKGEKGRQKNKENVEKVIENREVVDVAGGGDDGDDGELLPVPQVTVGPDGSIVINETSLVVKNTDENVASMNEIIDESDLFTTYGSFRQSRRSKAWTKKETAKFYKALSMVGIDFFLINQVFPNRKRFELKKKFKKEEKSNRLLVERVLKEGAQFDQSLFEPESSSDEEAPVKKQRKGSSKKKAGTSDGSVNTTVAKDTEPKKMSTRKRKKTRLSYYDDSGDSEIEETRQKQSSKSAEVVQLGGGVGTADGQPGGIAGVGNVSRADGEVVGILVDMSEGRLDGQAFNNFVEGGPVLPVRLHSNTASPAAAERQPRVVVESVPQMTSLTPGTQQLTLSSTGSQMTSLTPGTQQLTLSNTGSQPSVPSTAVSDTVVVPSISSVPNSDSVTQPPVPVVYQGNHQTGVSVLPVGDSNDQYVLVTVMPENSEETVLHIYRLQGGNLVPGLPNIAPGPGARPSGVQIENL